MKRTRMLLLRTVARLIFYAFICKYVYSESGIVTTILIACIIIENAVYADYSDAINDFTIIISEKTKEIIDFQNEYIIPRLKRNECRKDKRDTK